jgi:hypothetical protein
MTRCCASKKFKIGLEQLTSRILSIVIALVGLTLTGTLVAVAIHAATIALAAHDAAIKTR